jgi:hypothetical protein
MRVGASTLTIPIASAQPKEPDVIEAGHVPGGVLVPVTPGSPKESVTRRNNWRLSFPFTQGFLLTIRRLHVVLPVVLSELALEKSTTTMTTRKKYASKAEAVEAQGGKGGIFTKIQRIAPIGQDTHFVEEKITNVSKVEDVGEETNLVVVEEQVETLRSVIPTSVTVVVRINGPEGPIWADSYEAPIHYAQTAAPPGSGSGLVDAYADLVNGIPIAGAVGEYSMEILLAVPTTVATNTQIGPEMKNGAVVAGTQGAVTFFYDVEQAPMGK